MKIKSLTLRNYKRFKNQITIDFTDPESGEPMDMILLVADNGNGKSSVLQAIAACVGSAVKYGFKPDELDWPGFNYPLLSYYQPDFKVRANVIFSDAELEATKEFAKEVAHRKDIKLSQPSEVKQVSLLWTVDGIKADSNSQVSEAALRKQLYQFKGHQYAMQLSGTPDFMTLFDRIGSIVWFDERRDVDRSVASFSSEGLPDKMSNMKNLLSQWSNFHIRTQLLRSQDPNYKLGPGQHDFFDKLNQLFERIFPGRTLEGSAPSMNPVNMFNEGDAEFWLKEIANGNRYELSEISGAERAILPILLTFARWNINNSIILIDEAELHLHPPMQQAFVRMLPLLGKNNQFIITTHSDYVASMFMQDHIKRAPLWQ